MKWQSLQVQSLKLQSLKLQRLKITKFETTKFEITKLKITRLKITKLKIKKYKIRCVWSKEVRNCFRTNFFLINQPCEALSPKSISKIISNFVIFNFAPNMISNFVFSNFVFHPVYTYWLISLLHKIKFENINLAYSEKKSSLYIGWYLGFLNVRPSRLPNIFLWPAGGISRQSYYGLHDHS